MHLPKLQHGREILRLASPTVVTMLSMTLMWTVDTALLGRVSSLALGAAGLGGFVIWTAHSLFNNLSRISSTFVSQAHGRGDDEAAATYTWQVAFLSLLAGSALTGLFIFSDHVLPLTQTGERIEAATYTYVWIRGLSAIPSQLVMCLAGFFQGRKDVTTPMWAGIVANSVNAVLDLVLIFGVDALEVPAMGVAGAALATSIAITLHLLILLLAATLPRRVRARYALHRPRWPQVQRLWEVLRVGMPASVFGFLDMSFFMVFTAMVGRDGEVALAASQITVQLLSFSFMPVYGLATAATVLVGNALGERDPDRAMRYGRECYVVTLGYCGLVAVVFLLAGESLFRVFTPDPAVLALAAGLVPAAALFQIFDGGQLIGNGVLSGAGDTRYPALMSIVTLWLLAMPLVYWVVVHAELGVASAWYAATLGYGLFALTIFLRVRGGRWQRVSLSAE